VSLTPPASPDQPGMQDLIKDVMVDVPSHEIGSQSLASKKRLSQGQRKRARLRAQVSNNLSMDQRLPEPSQKEAPYTHGRKEASGAPGLAMVIVSEPSDLRPLPKGRRPEPKRVRGDDHGKDSVGKLKKDIPNGKPGKPALAFGTVPLRSGHSSHGETEEEVPTEDQGRSRATSTSRDQDDDGEEELQNPEDLTLLRSRKVDVVRQVDQASLSIRKTRMPDQLVRYNGEWAVQMLPRDLYEILRFSIPLSFGQGIRQDKSQYPLTWGT